MTREQKIVAIGAGGGVASMLAAMWLLYALLPAPSGMENVGDRLGYALRWAAVAALPLFAMLAALANARFASEAIDPTRGAEDKAMVIDGRVADNTLQQYVLFLAGSLALAAALPGGQVRVVAAAAIVFTICRMLFWIGYRIDPLYRAFGFSSTAYLNLGLLLAALWFGFA